MIFQRDELTPVVCNIRIPDGTGKEEIGTAIFIGKSDGAYLLTAAHVVKNINAQSYIILSDANGAPEKVTLGMLLGTNTFELHKQADLAKAKIDLAPGNIKYVEKRCFPYDHVDMSINLLSKDTELTTIGFPQGLGATGARFTPLTYRTFAAAPAITLPRFDNKIPCDFIILELPTIGGYSGGPLFDLGYVISGALTTTKEKTLLHGIVHGTIS
ncbi:MAG: trypsin-like peptidase domain-containing protein, partial [Bacteroidetes bacterium]|nr:trypsin-like peptidase domain-containing protein [Bacteroidota bacterium]